MSLPHALLTSLLEKPTSGSELARRFDKSIGYFWQATHQQIYRELARLEEAGLVSSTAEEGARGRKRNYKVLTAGKAELKRWMSQPSEHRNLRDEMMVRVRAAAIIGPHGLQEDIRIRLEHHQAQLALYREIEKHDFKDKPKDPKLGLQHLLLNAGIEYEQMYIDFCHKVLKQIESACDTRGKPRLKRA